MRTMIPQSDRLRIARPARLVLLASGLGGLFTLLGCSGSPLATRYSAERELWRARKWDQRLELRTNPEPRELTVAVSKYERILARYPLRSVGSDTTYVRSLGRVRAAAARSLSRLYFRQGARGKALDVLWNNRGEAPSDLEATIPVYQDLIDLVARGSDVDSLVDLYKEMAERLPAGTPSGRPVSAVLEAPSNAAEVLANVGRKAQADAAYEQALAWYDRVIADHPNTQVEVAAIVKKAAVLSRTQRPAQAEATLQQARQLPQAKPVDAQILYSLGFLHEQQLKDPRGAVALYRELLRLYPDPDSLPAVEAELPPQAGLRVAMCLASADQPDSALAMLKWVEERYERNTGASSQARYLSARVLVSTGRQEEALRCLRSVRTDFPRTNVGLLAPLEVAAYYQKTGDRQAEVATLRDAMAEYDRLISDFKSDPRRAALVLAAMDCSAEAAVRLQDWQAAAMALENRATTFPNDVRSPGALVQAAALLDSKLGDRPGCVRMLQALVQRYPSHPMSEKAKKKIEELTAAGTTSGQ